MEREIRLAKRCEASCKACYRNGIKEPAAVVIWAELAYKDRIYVCAQCYESGDNEDEERMNQAALENGMRGTDDPTISELRKYGK